MPTVVTSSIGASGCDYTTLAAWWAAKKGNLVTADQIQVAEVKGELHNTSTSACFTQVAGDATTDSTHYYIIRAQSGAEFRGKFADADVSGVARFTSTNSVLFKLEIPYTQIWNILVLDSSGAGVRQIFYSAGGATYAIIDGCGIDNCVSTGTTGCSMYGFDFTVAANNNYQIRNCAINDLRAAVTGTQNNKVSNAYGFYGNTTSTSGYVSNCTFVNISATNTSSGTGTTATAVGINYCKTVTNCIVLLTTASSVKSTASANDYGTISTQDHNVSEDSTASGTAPITGATPANEITNTTTASCDIHILTGAQSKNSGQSLSGSFTTDIDGETRPMGGTWDRGADEFTEASFLPQLIMV